LILRVTKNLEGLSFASEKYDRIDELLGKIELIKK
jgi:hypothetical protein